jgi:hypothetical protein
MSHAYTKNVAVKSQTLEIDFMLPQINPSQSLVIFGCVSGIHQSPQIGSFEMIRVDYLSFRQTK